jgi:hypothetical protein
MLRSDFALFANRTTVAAEGQTMKSRLLLSGLLIGGHILLCAAVSVGDGRDEPPLSPEGELVMNDPDTAAFCIARAKELGTKLDQAPESAGYFQWTLGAPLVSQNDTWGVVCRIDFKMAAQDVAPRVNRLILYVGAQKMNFTIAIGQDIAPLDAAAVPNAE